MKNKCINFIVLHLVYIIFTHTKTLKDKVDSHHRKHHQWYIGSRHRYHIMDQQTQKLLSTWGVNQIYFIFSKTRKFSTVSYRFDHNPYPADHSVRFFVDLGTKSTRNGVKVWPNVAHEILLAEGGDSAFIFSRVEFWWVTSCFTELLLVVRDAYWNPAAQRLLSQKSYVCRTTAFTATHRKKIFPILSPYFSSS